MVGEKEELPLRGMQANVRIDGFRARVAPGPLLLQRPAAAIGGQFPVAAARRGVALFLRVRPDGLPVAGKSRRRAALLQAGAGPHGDTAAEQILALRSGSWMEPKAARIVPRERRPYAYRETVRRRVDPALAEWSGAGVFQCRVFPLAPQRCTAS